MSSPARTSSSHLTSISWRDILLIPSACVLTCTPIQLTAGRRWQRGGGEGERQTTPQLTPVNMPVKWRFMAEIDGFVRRHLLLSRLTIVLLTYFINRHRQETST